MSDNVMTPKFRVSYPSIFKPQKNDLNGKMEYSLEALFEPGADLSALKAAAKAAVEKKWGKDQSAWPQNLRLPFRDQAEKKAKDKTTGKPTGELQPGCVAGAQWMRFKSEQKPGLVDQNVQDIIDESEFYGGCWARATVNAFAYDQKGNRGVSFGLVNIQKMADGDPFGRVRTKAADDFGAVEGASAFDDAPANNSPPAQKGPFD